RGVIELIDTHHHLWVLDGSAEYPWLRPGAPISHTGDVAAIRRDYALSDCLADMESVRLVGSVHVEAGRSPDQSLAETRWVQSIIDTCGRPNAIIANVDGWSAAFESELAAHRQFRALRGIRVRLNRAGQAVQDLGPGTLRVGDAAWDVACGLLEAHDLRLELQVTTPMVDDACEFAARYPGVRMALTHAGFPFDRSAD